jgi:simple sugar transport system permease protein
MKGSGLEAILTGALYFTVASALVLSLAATGELIQERAGVLNLGLEGVFIAGAFGGFYTAYELDSPLLGYVGGAAAAVLLGALFAALVVGMKLNQVVTGILFVALGIAVAGVLWDQAFGVTPEPPTLPDQPALAIPFLSEIPILGPALFRRNVAEYAALGVIAGATWVLYRTKLGLLIRSLGEAPEAAHFSGWSVNGYRFLAVVIGSAIAGLGGAGALLTIGQLGFYAPGVSAGRGWIAIGIVILGGWKPWGTLLAALMFGAATMLQFEVQAAGFDAIPHEFLVAFPYLVVIFSLVLRKKALPPPAQLGVPFSPSRNP